MSTTTCNEDDETLFRLQINIKGSCYWSCRTIMNWNIEDKYGTPVHRSEYNQQYTETTNEEFCLDRNECYKFSISSDYYNNAGYNLYQDGALVMSNLGSDSGDSLYNYHINDKYLSCITPSPSNSPTRPLSYPSNSYKYNGFAFGYFALILVPILLWCLCFQCCNGQTQRRQQQHHTADETTSAETWKQNRRFKILTGVIHKKVLPKPKKEEKNTNTTPELDIEVALPHEAYFSSRNLQKEVSSDNSSRQHSKIDSSVFEDEQVSSVRKLQKKLSFSSIVPILPSFPISQPSGFHKESSDDQQVLPDRKLKDDIHAASMRSLRSAMGIQNESTSSLYSPKVCPICMETYKVGEEIAWSKNEDCCHAFHLDCISEWLMDNDDCPMCRRAFLEVDNSV